MSDSIEEAVPGQDAEMLYSDEEGREDEDMLESGGNVEVGGDTNDVEIIDLDSDGETVHEDEEETGEYDLEIQDLTTGADYAEDAVFEDDIEAETNFPEMNRHDENDEDEDADSPQDFDEGEEDTYTPGEIEPTEPVELTESSEAVGLTEPVEPTESNVISLEEDDEDEDGGEADAFDGQVPETELVEPEYEAEYEPEYEDDEAENIEAIEQHLDEVENNIRKAEQELRERHASIVDIEQEDEEDEEEENEAEAAPQLEEVEPELDADEGSSPEDAELEDVDKDEDDEDEDEEEEQLVEESVEAGTATEKYIGLDDEADQDVDHEADHDADHGADHEEDVHANDLANGDESHYSEEDEIDNHGLDPQQIYDIFAGTPVNVHYKNEVFPLAGGDQGLLDDFPSKNISLEVLFDHIRETVPGLPDDKELVFYFPQLDLRIGEDNLYTKEAALLDMIELLAIEPHAESLHIDLCHDESRFISKFNQLFAQLAELPPAKRPRIEE